MNNQIKQILAIGFAGILSSAAAVTSFAMQNGNSQAENSSNSVSKSSTTEKKAVDLEIKSTLKDYMNSQEQVFNVRTLDADKSAVKITTDDPNISKLLELPNEEGASFEIHQSFNKDGSVKSIDVVDKK